MNGSIEQTIVPSIGQIMESRRRLGNPYAYLDGSGAFSATMPPMEALIDPVNASRRSKRHSNRQIERQATDLLKTMWNNRSTLWRDTPPSDPIEIIDPARAFEIFGFSFSHEEDLGKYYGDNGFLKVAGLINNDDKTVQVSNQFPQSIRMFTAAHELGHAVLHNLSGSLHRDRPVDGSSFSRDCIEYEADKFATYFLMPAKLVMARFMEIFGTESFSLNEDTAFALQCRPLSEIRERCRTSRELSQLLASAGSYNGRFFPSLANQFRVSIEAMAIRLEELSLVEG